jgi:superfamily II DNA/RNA helicase
MFSRVGRTARAGRAGRAVTFVSQYDVELYQRIEHLLGNHKSLLFVWHMLRLKKPPVSGDLIFFYVPGIHFYALLRFWPPGVRMTNIGEI